MQWLEVVDKMSKFPSFSEVLKDIKINMDNKIPEKTKRKAFAISYIIKVQKF